MPIDITMPRLSDTMEAGTIIKWNVKAGDKVSAGDVIADVETDKATMEMAVYDDGVVSKIAVPEGQKVNVGTVIAVLDADAGASAGQSQPKAAARSEGASAPNARASGGAATAVAEPPGRSAPAKTPPASPGDHEQDAHRAVPQRERSSPGRAPASAEDEPEGEQTPAGNGRLRISPVARHLADEHGIDLRSIEGSGPNGRVIKRDVLAAIEAARENSAAVPPSAKKHAPAEAPLATRIERDQPQGSRSEMPVRGERATIPAPAPFAQGGLEPQMVPLSNMRQVIARRLVESKTAIPHYQVTVTFDMNPLLGIREMLNAQLGDQGVKLSVNDFLVRACALAIHEHPYFNAAWAGDHIEILGDVNIGMAISLPEERGGGLVVGVIRHADAKGLRQVSLESKALAEKARTRGLTIQEMSDSTFTISNLGMYGVENFTAVINPPQAGILAVGAIEERAVVVDGDLEIQPRMNMTLTIDHRSVDGATASEFLATVKSFLEEPGLAL